MRTRSIQLRWHGRCCVCLAELAAGELGRYDPVRHEITCSRCAAGEAPIDRPVTPVRTALPSRRRRTSEVERERVRSLIAETRAKLDAARHAS